MIYRFPLDLYRLPLAAGLAVTLWATPAAAHDLVIAVELKGDEIVVTVTYDDGSRPSDATVVVSSDGKNEILRTPLADNGTATLDRSLAADGLIIEAFDPEGHSSYRILTPADLGSENGHP